MLLDNNNSDGTIAIKEGELIIKDPRDLGRYPRISPGGNVNLYIDNIIIEDEVVVSEDVQEKIKIEINCPKSGIDFSLQISEDRLKAYLAVDILPDLKLVLKDKVPANHLIIETEIRESKNPVLLKEDVNSYLQEKNIIYGIKEENINRLIKDNESSKILIAEGKEPVKGEDAHVIKTGLYKRHDIKDFTNIESFVKGDMIAYKVSAKTGEEGIDIYGNSIEPKSPKDIILRAGDGVIISKDGLKAVAQKSGRASFDEYNNIAKVSIISEYIIKGNVDKTTGNINYQGDLFITGNINDYFDINVSHNIQVGGNIANARIVSANGNLKVRNNIIASYINLGNHLNPDLISDFKLIKKQISNLLEAIEQILGEIDKRQAQINNFKVGRILRLLIINKFSGLPEQLKDINKEIDPKNKMIKNKFNDITSLISNTSILENMDNELPLKDFYSWLDDIIIKQSKNEQRLDITTGYIQSSIINILGDVTINKLGCVNSTISALGSIIVKSKKGFLRGGKYSSGKLIYTYEMGSRLSPTIAIIGTRIYIKKITGELKIIGPKETREYGANNSTINLKVNEMGKFEEMSKPPL